MPSITRIVSSFQLCALEEPVSTPRLLPRKSSRDLGDRSPSPNESCECPEPYQRRTSVDPLQSDYGGTAPPRIENSDSSSIRRSASAPSSQAQRSIRFRSIRTGGQETIATAMSSRSGAPQLAAPIAELSEVGNRKPARPGEEFRMRHRIRMQIVNNEAEKPASKS